MILGDMDIFCEISHFDLKERKSIILSFFINWELKIHLNKSYMAIGFGNI